MTSDDLIYLFGIRPRLNHRHHRKYRFISDLMCYIKFYNFHTLFRKFPRGCKRVLFRAIRLHRDGKRRSLSFSDNTEVVLVPLSVGDC